MSELARFLVDLLLHPSLRALATADLDEALRGYAVSAEERCLLAAHDPALLSALGEAVRGAGGPHPGTLRIGAETAEHSVLADESTQVRALPQAALWVRLLPVVGADGDVLYVVGVGPAEAGAAPPTLAVKGTKLPPIDLDLRVLPSLGPDGMRFAGGLLPRAPEGSPDGVRVARPPAPRRARPHADPEHPAVRRAALAARAAADPLPAVVALIEALLDPGPAQDPEPPLPPLPPLPGGPHITVVGLGVVCPDQVSLEAERAIRGAREVLYANAGAADLPWLRQRCPRVTPLLPAAYVEGGDRLQAYVRMAALTLAAALDHPPVVFAMSGHPLIGAYAPFLIADAGRALGLEVRIQPGISALDAILAQLEIDPVLTGIQMVEATDLLLQRRPLQADMPALVWQVGTVGTGLHSDAVRRPEQFAPLRDHLLRFWPAEHPVTALHVSAHPWVRGRVDTVPLGELCALAPHLHAGVSLWVPALGARPLADPELAAALGRLDRIGAR